MEVTVKLRLLLTSALFLSAQIATTRAQETSREGTPSFSIISCSHVILATSSVLLWIGGYYNGKRNNTIIEPDTVKKDEEKVNLYCYQHREVTVMDAVKNVLGFDK